MHRPESEPVRMRGLCGPPARGGGPGPPGPPGGGFLSLAEAAEVQLQLQLPVPRVQQGS